MHVYATFDEFIKSAVIPHKAAHPDWERLDGWDRIPAKGKEGNLSVFAHFLHNGKRWKVHSDSKFDPLLQAHSKGPQPFVEEPTDTGKGTRLQTEPHSKWMYIYLAET